LLEILIIVALTFANGLFAMSEIAVVSSRRAKLQSMADAGNTRARTALALVEYPTRFLATVQIGITLVGIFAGAYGGVTLAQPLAEALGQVPFLAPYSGTLSLVLVVVGITYLSLVVGELVPKRIALNAPEHIAMTVAGPMNSLSVAAAPFVKLLSLSTEGLLRLLRVKKSDEPPVSEAEIGALLEQGAQAGVVTLNDVLEGLVGDLPAMDRQDVPMIVPREDGSWLLDGLLSTDELKDLLGEVTLPQEEEHDFYTLGGFLVTNLGRIPTVGEVYRWGEWRFEVVDMDGTRVDQVLLTRLPEGSAEASEDEKAWR